MDDAQRTHCAYVRRSPYCEPSCFYCHFITDLTRFYISRRVSLTHLVSRSKPYTRDTTSDIKPYIVSSSHTSHNTQVSHTSHTRESERDQISTDNTHVKHYSPGYHPCSALGFTKAEGRGRVITRGVQSSRVCQRDVHVCAVWSTSFSRGTFDILLPAVGLPTLHNLVLKVSQITNTNWNDFASKSRAERQDRDQPL